MLRNNIVSWIRGALKISCHQFRREMGSEEISDIKSLFKASVVSVCPRTLIQKNVKVKDNCLTVCGKDYDISKGCSVVGFGKAVLGMAIELERILGGRLSNGILSVPTGIFEALNNKPNMFPPANTKLNFLEGAKNNLPDENAAVNAKLIMEFIQQLNNETLVIVLISGGGSALLPLAKEPIKLDEKLKLVRMLSLAGATIEELNIVRKQVSALKGGGLARLAYPKQVVSLILSDVIGDPLDIIASGPTCVNTDTIKDARLIVEKYRLRDDLPKSIRKVLYIDREPIKSAEQIVPIINDNFAHVDNYLVGNNTMAVEAACRLAQQLNYAPCILTTSAEGPVALLAEKYLNLVETIIICANDMMPQDQFAMQLRDVITYLQLPYITVSKLYNTIVNYKCLKLTGICIIAGGEPTVHVRGRGVGGRNQELALRLSRMLNQSGTSRNTVTFLSCGTDGIDGPTDAAGAIGFSGLADLAHKKKIIIGKYICNNDSNSFYTLFENGKYIVRTGHTGTNVMDIHIFIIKP